MIISFWQIKHSLKDCYEDNVKSNHKKTGRKFSKAIKTILTNTNCLLSTSKTVFKTSFGMHHTTWCQIILRGYSNQNSIHSTGIKIDRASNGGE